MRTFGRIIDQPQRHIVVALGIMSGPPESLNTYPHVNYRVFQDMEFHVLANDPQFDGVFGVMGYTAGYAEEETIRWLGKLYRHYCIEGHTTRLTDEPYLLNHLVNPDFAEGTTGWNIKPAEPQTISIRKVRHLGSLEGRFGSGAAGDQCLVMVRSAKAPNVIDQQIKNLQPGALYALRMYSSGLKKASGYRNPTFNDYTTLEIRIDNTTRVPEKSFRHIYLAIHGKPEARMYFNYWVRVFRAKGRTAELTISDWKSPDERFGNIGAQTGINFVEVQRYLEE